MRGNSCRLTSSNQSKMLPVTLKRSVRTGYLIAKRNISYVQGQSPEPKVREYFYYIDHQGQLFLDDTKVKNFITCFKDKKFLAFFFKRLKINNLENDYRSHFPYLSPCGRERNYIRCDDRPFVFTHILSRDNSEQDLLACNFCGDKLTVPLEPENIFMLPQSGRIYHPAPEKVGGVGLIKSSIAIEISSLFEFGEKGEYAPPVYFIWKGKRHRLTYNVLPLMTEEEKQELDL